MIRIWEISRFENKDFSVFLISGTRDFPNPNHFVFGTLFGTYIGTYLGHIWDIWDIGFAVQYRYNVGWLGGR